LASWPQGHSQPPAPSGAEAFSDALSGAALARRCGLEFVSVAMDNGRVAVWTAADLLKGVTVVPIPHSLSAVETYGYNPRLRYHHNMSHSPDKDEEDQQRAAAEGRSAGGQAVTAADLRACVEPHAVWLAHCSPPNIVSLCTLSPTRYVLHQTAPGAAGSGSCGETSFTTRPILVGAARRPRLHPHPLTH
jgi:hypothetical protein